MIPASDATIRRARAADLDALVAIETECFAGDRLSRRQLAHHLGSPRSTIWIAVDAGDRPLAYLLLLEHSQRPPRIYSLATRAAARGQGIGARLVDAAAAASRAAGYERLRLEVRVDAAAARALYRGRGFVEVGALPGYYEDGADGVAMELRLDPGARRS